jgi:serine/threonine protein kinase
MALSVGARLGSYEILSAIGAGGMGEVYRARDTKLDRDVAIKVLPEAFLSDPERRHRFEREAKVLASLNHPNIAALHGMEESGDRRFLIMELVEGETLADRIEKPGSQLSALSSQPCPGLPVSEALDIARQIAEALEAAHEQGVVHRDLKPADVILQGAWGPTPTRGKTAASSVDSPPRATDDIRVKVLDFGLAKAMETGSGTDARSKEPAYTHSPTFSMVATQAGMILGTAAYMSPEQAKGLRADHRSDIFSFGVVLYEMLTGRQPFQGDTAPDVIASVMVRDADLGSLPPDLNPQLPDLVCRCLEKHPKKRWQAIGDVRAELDAIAAAPYARPAQAAPVAEPRPLCRRGVPIAITAVVAGALGGAAVWTFRSSAPPTVVRFAFALPEGQNFTNRGRQLVAISPDGTKIVYVANQRLHLRSTSDLEARPIPGTDIAQSFVTNPVFSPDGLSVAFYSSGDSALKRIALSGGAAVTICPADNPFGMSWNEDGIVFGQVPDCGN